MSFQINLEFFLPNILSYINSLNMQQHFQDEDEEMEYYMSSCEIEQYTNYEDDLKCPISLDLIPEGHKFYLTKCGHKFSSKIFEWLKVKRECPFCREPFPEANQHQNNNYSQICNFLRKILIQHIINIDQEDEHIGLWIFFLQYSYSIITEEEKEELTSIYTEHFERDGGPKSLEKIFPWL